MLFKLRKELFHERFFIKNGAVKTPHYIVYIFTFQYEFGQIKFTYAAGTFSNCCIEAYIWTGGFVHITRL